MAAHCSKRCRFGFVGIRRERASWGWLKKFRLTPWESRLWQWQQQEQRPRFPHTHTHTHVRTPIYIYNTHDARGIRELAAAAAYGRADSLSSRTRTSNVHIYMHATRTAAELVTYYILYTYIYVAASWACAAARTCTLTIDVWVCMCEQYNNMRYVYSYIQWIYSWGAHCMRYIYRARSKVYASAVYILRGQRLHIYAHMLLQTHTRTCIYSAADMLHTSAERVHVWPLP